MKNLCFVLVAFWIIGAAIFPDPKGLQTSADDAKRKCHQYSIPCIAPDKSMEANCAGNCGQQCMRIHAHSQFSPHLVRYTTGFGYFPKA